MTFHEKKLIDEYFSSESDRQNAYERLNNREPLAYILGEWYFFKEKYIVTPDVLVPQPDTEILVENAIKKIPSNSNFIDLCTGSGCIAISVLASRPDLSATAIDISPAALKTAAKNASLNGVADRINFICADITAENFASNFLSGKKFSALLSNPPYINSDIIDTLEPEVRAEPRIALDGGNDGLKFYRVINGIYDKILLTSSVIILEIGYDQKEAVKSILGDGQIIRDYSGNDRVFIKELV